MESDSHSPTPAEATWRDRWGLHGDLPMRVFLCAARHCPWFIEPILLFGYTLFIFTFGTAPRKAVQKNLRVLFPHASWPELCFKSYRVFREFAEAMKDGMFARADRDLLTWEIAGREKFSQFGKDPEHGGIILTAHMGNYDIAAPLFADHFPCPVHAVRAPERQARFQDMQREHFNHVSRKHFQIHYNDTRDQFLGVELARILSRGEMVAIQGDRIVFDVSPVNVPYPGSDKLLRIPNGPFVLAMISGAAMHPLFVVRTGHRRYRVIVRSPIQFQRDRSARKKALADATQEWVSVLSNVITEYWTQWFVFESAFVTEESDLESADTLPLPKGSKTDNVETIRNPMIRPVPWGLSVFMAGSTVLLLSAFWVYVALIFGLKGLHWWFLLVLALPFAVFDSVHILLAAAAGLTWFSNKLTGTNSGGKQTEWWALILGSGVALWLVITAPFTLKLTVIPWFIGLIARAMTMGLPPR